MGYTARGSTDIFAEPLELTIFGADEYAALQADQTEARILLRQEGSRAKAAHPLSHARTYNRTV